LANLENVLKAASRARKTGDVGQLSLMDTGNIQVDCGINYILNIPDYSEKEKLELERELLPFHMGEHPLKKYKHVFRRRKVTNITQLEKIPEGSRVTVGGTVVNSRRQPTRNNEYMLIMLLEDMYGQVEVVVFPRTYQQYLYELNPEGIIVIGKITYEGEHPKIIAESIRALSSLPDGRAG